ncbi:hypothetical protein [Motilimonas cestriensis]|uniref:hypothetical protein n=1 Tax=Motilimonas cestriensis TaxID=2742685 RepID=UPI003DA5C752
MQKLLILFLATLSFEIIAAEQSCMSKYSAYADAQLLWQNESTALIVETIPKHRSLANYYRDVQIAAIERRRLAVKLTLQHYTDKINTDAKLNNWINYSPELETELSEKSSDFKAAVDAYEKIKNIHPSENGDEFRKAFRGIVNHTKEFQFLLSEFNKKVKGLNDLKCKVT